jgi:hypothetical protein
MVGKGLQINIANQRMTLLKRAAFEVSSSMRNSKRLLSFCGIDFSTTAGRNLFAFLWNFQLCLLVTRMDRVSLNFCTWLGDRFQPMFIQRHELHIKNDDDRSARLNYVKHVRTPRPIV